MDRIEEILLASKDLLAEVKASRETLSLANGHRLYSTVRETEGWLQSVRKCIEPEGGI